MQITATLATLCASIALVSAQHGAAQVDFCKQPKFVECTTQSSKQGACIPLEAGQVGQGSVKPHTGNFCYFFTNNNCGTDGQLFHVGSRGNGDLSKTDLTGAAKMDFVDKVMSYKCHADDSQE